MRLRLPFAFAFLIILLLASSAGLLPHSALPQTPESARKYVPRHSDKALHFATFFALTAAFYFIFDTARRRVLHLTLVVCTLVLSVGSEVAQGLLPNDREFDPYDVLANVLGSLAALGLATSYHKRSIERRRRAKYSALSGEGMEDDVELGQGPGLSSQQETGIVALDGAASKKTVEEEVDNWDENAADEWSDDENHGDATTKMTPATSSVDSSEESRRKVAVD